MGYWKFFIFINISYFKVYMEFLIVLFRNVSRVTALISM